MGIYNTIRRSTRSKTIFFRAHPRLRFGNKKSSYITVPSPCIPVQSSYYNPRDPRLEHPFYINRGWNRNQVSTSLKVSPTKKSRTLKRQSRVKKRLFSKDDVGGYQLRKLKYIDLVEKYYGY